MGCLEYTERDCKSGHTRAWRLCSALKENHKILYEDVNDYFDEEQKKYLQKMPKKYKKTIEKEPSCVETREYYMENEIVWLEDARKWNGLQSIGMAILRLVQENYTMSLHKIRYSLSLDFEEEIGKIFSLLNVEKIESMVK